MKREKNEPTSFISHNTKSQPKMKFAAALFLALAGSAAAFVPVSTGRMATALSSRFEDKVNPNPSLLSLNLCDTGHLHLEVRAIHHHKIEARMDIPSNTCVHLLNVCRCGALIRRRRSTSTFPTRHPKSSFLNRLNLGLIFFLSRLYFV